MSQTYDLRPSYMEAHSDLAIHYHFNWGGYYLGFSEEWRDKNLPTDPDTSPEDFLVTLIDTDSEEPHAHYTMNKFVTGIAYANKDSLGDLPNTETWKYEPVQSLMPYFYGSHYCPCHRKQDARGEGAETDEECEGDRFQILKIEYKKLILCSEYLDIDSLEKLLEQK